MDNNKANVCNPNNRAGGLGNRPAGYRGAGDKADLDNRSKMLNPQHPLYYKSRNKGTKADLDNHANQLNPHLPLYYRCRNNSESGGGWPYVQEDDDDDYNIYFPSRMDNSKVNVYNPNNRAGGLGNRPAGYRGAGTKADLLYNHANQLNPQHPLYYKGRNNWRSGGGWPYVQEDDDDDEDESSESESEIDYRRQQQQQRQESESGSGFNWGAALGAGAVLLGVGLAAAAYFSEDREEPQPARPNRNQDRRE